MFAFGVIQIAVWNLRQAIPLFRSGELDTQVFTVINHLIAAILLVALLAVSAGFLGEFAPAVYLSGLYFLLVLCSYFFIMVILAVDMRTGK